MNRKKAFVILLILIVVGVIIYFISTNISINKVTNDAYQNYTPQEEISDEQIRQTSLILYFLDTETNKLKSEIRLIDSTELLNNPYKTIVQNLLSGPTSENLKSVFPENTRLVDANLVNNCVILNFSEELKSFTNDEEKFNIINSLLNSLTQLTEVHSIKILINNEPYHGLDEEYAEIS